MIWLIVVFATVVVAVTAVAAAVTAHRVRRWKQTIALRRQFGPEYDRILAQEGGDQGRADASLRARRRRRAALQVRDLTPESQARYAERWHAARVRFVDAPRAAVRDAAKVVSMVLAERGYQADPTSADRPEARAYDELDLVAVDHPAAAVRFRAVDRTLDDARASTEDLRVAFQGCEAVFTVMLDRGEPARGTAAPVGTPALPAPATPVTSGTTKTAPMPVLPADDPADDPTDPADDGGEPVRRVIDVRRQTFYGSGRVVDRDPQVH